MRIRTILLAASAVFAVAAMAAPMASAKSSAPEAKAPPEPVIISQVVPAESIPLEPGFATFECPRGYQLDPGGSGAGGNNVSATATRTALLVSRTAPSAEGETVEIQLVCVRGQSGTARTGQAR